MSAELEIDNNENVLWFDGLNVATDNFDDVITNLKAMNIQIGRASCRERV